MRLAAEHWVKRISGLLWLFALLAGCNADDAESQAPSLSERQCPLGEAVETEGQRRLALIVGVGEYRSGEVPDLAGPPQDARRFYELLTGRNGYGFPEENVCLLLDGEATTEGFKQGFQRALVSRARANDVVVFFFAGHGSQAPDSNQDEPDELDETFLFHDARTQGIRDLPDDKLNRMLAQLRQKTRNVTVILDSCNSGTATRGEAGTYVARYVAPATDLAGPAVDSAEGVGDGGKDWFPEVLPGLVVFTAASDGTPALERAGRGIFTDAILKVLSQAGDDALTYAQAARQIPPLVAAESYQIPYFHGALDRSVFGTAGRTRPFGWEVRVLGPPIELAGPPLPGVGRGAEFRLYDGAVSGADTRDPGKAKATVVMDDWIGVNASAHVSAARPDAPPIALGDRAVLARPADTFLKIQVRLRPAGEPSGIPRDRAAALRAAIEENTEAKALVELTEGAGDFELSVAGDGKLIVRGPENRIRKTYAADDEIPENLWQHARQRALLLLQGEGGADFADYHTLQRIFQLADGR